MLKGKMYKNIVRIICLVLLMLLVVVMCMLLKMFSNYLEIRSIDEIWPDGEHVILQCALVFFAVASVVFFIRMVWLEAKCETLKFKLKTGNNESVDEEVEITEEPKKPAVKLKKQSPKEPKVSREQKALSKKVKSLEAWKKIVKMIYPDVDNRVDKFFKENPVYDPNIIDEA